MSRSPDVQFFTDKTETHCSEFNTTTVSYGITIEHIVTDDINREGGITDVSSERDTTRSTKAFHWSNTGVGQTNPVGVFKGQCKFGTEVSLETTNGDIYTTEISTNVCFPKCRIVEVVIGFKSETVNSTFGLTESTKRSNEYPKVSTSSSDVTQFDLRHQTQRHRVCKRRRVPIKQVILRGSRTNSPLRDRRLFRTASTNQTTPSQAKESVQR